MGVLLVNDAQKTVIITPKYKLWEIDAQGKTVEYRCNGEGLAQIQAGTFYPSYEGVMQIVGELDKEIFEGLSHIIPNYLQNTLNGLASAMLGNLPGFYIGLLRAYSVHLPGVLRSYLPPGVVVEITSHAYYVYCDGMPILNVTQQCCFVPLVYWSNLSGKIDVRVQEEILERSIQGVDGTIREARNRIRHGQSF